MCDLPHTLKLFESNKTSFFCTSLMFLACAELLSSNQHFHVIHQHCKYQIFHHQQERSFSSSSTQYSSSKSSSFGNTLGTNLLNAMQKSSCENATSTSFINASGNGMQTFVSNCSYPVNCWFDPV